jgi:hypothetical protein
MFNSGCFVLTSEWRNKPEGPPQAIESHDGSDGEMFSRIFDSPEFRLEVTVENGPLRWEAPFLFYIIPIPTSYPYLAHQPLRVDLALEPKVGQLAFDPRKTFFVGTNQARVAPANAWQEWGKTNFPLALPVATNINFGLLYAPWDRIPPDRALPFQLSIEGLTVSDRTISLPPITFKPETFVRPGFKLPY